MPDTDRLVLLAEAELARREALRVRAHAEYQTWPVDWIVDQLGVARDTLQWSLNPAYERHDWDGTPDPLVAILEGLAQGKDVGVESATGTGKTFLAACVTVWFLACFENSIVVTAAPKQDQLKLHLWKELGRLWPRFRRHFPAASLLDGKLRMLADIEFRESWTATAFVCGVGADEESATKAQGFHAEHMLIITEETPGIDDAIMTAFENTRTDAHNLHLALGNPDNRFDALHRFCTKPSVRHVRISALDHPNVVTGGTIVPGAVSLRRVEERKRQYGEDSRMYRSRVRGVSPAEAHDALIRIEWCREASGRYSFPQFRQGAAALGVDVANSEDGDRAAIASGIGACLLEVRAFACPDSVQLGVDVGGLMKAEGIDPRRVGVDSIGVGAGTVGRLKEMGYRVRALNSGTRAPARPDDEARARTGGGVPSYELFANLRAAMWWKLREDLRRGHVALPNDADLFEDITTPAWFTRNGKIFVEPKEDIRERIGRSPDKGDATVLWNWVRARPQHERVERDEQRLSRNFDQGYEHMRKSVTERVRRGQDAMAPGRS
ncbi:MAG: hypothetical protein FJ207_01615 [Gemmatimonadetes bacterium]|nr:hypothetical protein [Gemmatimonadota bacterium]